MLKLLSSFVRAILTKIVNRLDTLDTLDRKTQDPRDNYSQPSQELPSQEHVSVALSRR
jgi:hypothetical protein